MNDIWYSVGPWRHRKTYRIEAAWASQVAKYSNFYISLNIMNSLQRPLWSDEFIVSQFTVDSQIDFWKPCDYLDAGNYYWIVWKYFNPKPNNDLLPSKQWFWDMIKDLIWQEVRRNFNKQELKSFIASTWLSPSGHGLFHGRQGLFSIHYRDGCSHCLCDFKKDPHIPRASGTIAMNMVLEICEMKGVRGRKSRKETNCWHFGSVKFLLLIYI